MSCCLTRSLRTVFWSFDGGYWFRSQSGQLFGQSLHNAIWIVNALIIYSSLSMLISVLEALSSCENFVAMSLYIQDYRWILYLLQKIEPWVMYVAVLPVCIKDLLVRGRRANEMEYSPCDEVFYGAKSKLWKLWELPAPIAANAMMWRCQETYSNDGGKNSLGGGSQSCLHCHGGL